MSVRAPDSEALVEGAAAQPPPTKKRRSCAGAATALFGVLFGLIYITNPGLGVIELIPDNVPLFGNLDEAAATTMLVLGLQYLFGRNRED